MIERLLKSQLEPVARRHRQLRLWRSLAVCWAIAALGALFSLWLRSEFQLNRSAALTLVGVIALAAFIAALIYFRRGRIDYRNIARQIEGEHPDLHALLITAVEQQPDPATRQLNYLQARVIREALVEVQKRNLVATTSTGSLTLAQAAHLCTLALALTIVAKLATVEQPQFILGKRLATNVKVEPGDVSIERGSGLVVLARFSGPLPGAATLVAVPNGEEPRRIPLERTLSDPVFGGSVPEVISDMTYFVEYENARTRDFKVKVFEYPRLERADAEIKYPDYTGLPAKRVPDTRRVSAVEGSHVALHLQLNKPVVSARLIARDKSVLPLLAETNRAMATLPQLVFDNSQTYQLELVDADKRTNKVPAQIVFDVLKNRTPELKLAAPRGDQRVSPLEEMAFAAEATDDYGLQAMGLTYAVAGKEAATITFDAHTAPHEKRLVAHLLRLEELRTQPDQLVSWFAWADDIGPDGTARRTATDMFFAEVRPFDEIYREGTPGDQGGEMAGMQGGGGQTMRLAELQKQIINATWKLQRQFPSNSPAKAGATYKKDAGVVHDSQESALQQAGALKMRVDDPRFRVLWEKVEDQMREALKHLSEATESTTPLPSALTAEQAAYQALLSLSAREYQVTRNRRGGGGGGGGGERNRQQLENLDLKQERDRYETQRQAAPQQRPEQREQLAVLNRLKELAQRQNDLNERLKELQTALREAKTEEQKRELQRELKRLRDEQRELLADVDELRERMEQPQNQSQMAETRQQLEETRSQVQSAAEALENEAVGQALSAGTRAQRELQEMRDDFRKRNSNQFAEDMREMRQTARELAEKQEQITKQVESERDTKRKTLSGSEESQALAQKFQEQKTGLTNLLQNMREVSDKSESSEPMLSRQLYETVRKASQSNLENNLQLSEELVKRSFLPEAAQFSRRTQQELEEIKRGVEEAASGVLGDEAESLRFAKNELDDLVNQLDRELTSRRGITNETGQVAGGDPQRQGERAGGGTNESAQASAAVAGGQTNRQATARAQAQQGNEQSAQSGRNGESQSAQGQQQANGQSSGQQQGGRSGSDSQGQANAQNSQGQQQAYAQGSEGQGQQQANAQGSEGRGQQANGDAQRGGRGRFDTARWNAGERGGVDGGGDGFSGPLTGQEFREWSDRLSQVEELLDEPRLRSDAARIRDRARSMRAEFKRHSKEPQWDLVRGEVFGPLVELRNRVAEELARHESTESLVPIDRDPVPNKFSDMVRRYYEKLGTAQQ